MAHAKTQRPQDEKAPLTQTTESGAAIEKKTVDRFLVGRTTRQEILAPSGVPETVTWEEDGTIEYLYSFYTSAVQSKFLRTVHSSDSKSGALRRPTVMYFCCERSKIHCIMAP